MSATQFKPAAAKTFKSQKAAVKMAQSWSSTHGHEIVRLGKEKYAVVSKMTRAKYGLTVVTHVASA